MNPVCKPAALFAAIVVSFSPVVRADDARTLDTVQVTASRSAQPVELALASVTVLDRATIEASQAPDLIDLLARQAGIDVSRTGGAGSASTVFMRGTNSNHTLVLIDGLRVNSASQGVFDFAHLPLAEIERIEIVRGPRAALWGSDAIGGVIQIFTRDPSAAYAEIRAGSYGRAGIDAGIGSGADKGTRFGISAGIEHVRGFSATNPHAGFFYNPDDDGYRNHHLGLRAQTVLGSQRLGFSGLITDADVDFDQGATAARNSEFGFVLAGELARQWTHSLSLGQSREDLDTPAYGNRVISRRHSLDWVNTLTVGDHQTLNLGLNWSQESALSLDAFSVSGIQFDRSRRNSGLFANWRSQFGKQSFELSLRRDDNSQFGGATTGQAAWGWAFSDHGRLRASWGQGFRAPNLNELYYPGFEVAPNVFLFSGNAQLQPERSQSVEFGLDLNLGDQQTLSLSAFRSRIAQLIAFDGVDFQAINIDHAAIDGVELGYQWRHGAFALDGNATWQQARDQDSGHALLRRPDRKLQLSGSYRYADGGALALDLSSASRRRDFDGTLGSYTRFDLRYSRPLAGLWTLEARIENLGDRKYELASGFNTPGRSGLLTLRWNESR